MAENYFKLLLDTSVKIEKAYANFKKSPKDRIKISYLEVRLEFLEQQWNLFSTNHRKIVFEVPQEQFDQSDYAKNETYDATEELYYEYKADLKEKLLELKSKIPEPKKEESKGNEQANLKLPTIEIPKFSGKYSEWVGFRDLFTSIVHDNPNIPDVQKLHYLKGYLTGEAEQLLRHLPITGDNYTICWSQLESRYNNKKYLSTCILKRLTGQKTIVSESASCIKQLLDTTIECLHALENIGVDTSTWDVIVVFLVSQKLDPESRKQWEQKLTESSQDLPTLQLFEEFLENKFRSLEFLDQKVQKSSFAHVATANTTTLCCAYCNDNHKISNCKKFGKCDVDARREFVQTQRLCFNCMNYGHSVYQCTMSTKCRLCRKKHHTMLHPKKPMSENSRTDQPADEVVAAVAGTSTPQASGDDSAEVIATCAENNSQVLLATALVHTRSIRNQTLVTLRSFIDPGSQLTLVTEETVQMLSLKKIPETRVVSGLGGDQPSNKVSKAYVELKLQSRLDPNFTLTVKAHVLEKLTSFLPCRRVATKVLPALSSLALADPKFHIPNKVDLLLSADVYAQIVLDGLIRGSPGTFALAQNTTLGWILFGRTPTQHSSDEMCHSVVSVSMHVSEESGDDLIKRFWELEAEPDFSKVKILTEEEKACEELFSRTTQRDKDGRYIVKLPFKSSDPQCKYNGSKNIALKRFLMLEKRFARNPELKSDYLKVMKEYLELGHMEAVPPREIDHPNAVYTPHHAVIRKDKATTKTRVVLDAACVGENGVSLNKDLMVGPTLQPDLRHLIIRWRCYPIALVADIVKMYRQVMVTEEDTDFQRILWRDNPNDELQHYRLLTVMFGTSCAPYLAVRAMQQLAFDEGPEFPLARDRVLQDFYMDDLLTGCHSVTEGKQIFEQMTAMLSRGGFPLQKWSSNNQDLLKHINSGHEEAAQAFELRTDETARILGLIWNKDKDEFRCTITLPDPQGPDTKRRVISDIARLFDPLGWIAPVITAAKVFIQKIWLSGIGWDDVLPVPLLQEWIDFRGGLTNLVDVRIPRWIKTRKDDQSFELHGFSDASNVAFAAVVYSRVVDSNGGIHVSLITSKTRVAPVKQVSIPRLELCGAVLLAKLLNEVAGVLDVQKQNLHAWTDSSIVLAWLRSHPSRWKTFVANRVSEILTITDSSQWAHVASKDNPADAASRGLSASEHNQNRLWYEGPEWLRKEKISYDRGEEKGTNLEEKKPVVVCHATTGEEKDFDVLARFSSLRKLTRVLSYCRRVLHWKLPEKERSKKISKALTAKEINDSHLICIKLCQQEYFGEEIRSLQSKKPISKKSKLTSLAPFLDETGVLRVSGRLSNAPMPYDTKHPIIIPQRSHFTNLLIHEAHERTLHGGPQLVLNYLRSKYWMLGAKSVVRQFIKRCVICVRHSSQTNQQLMGQLPISRVCASPPFRMCGVDYAGPINIRSTKGRGHRSKKGYICLFVCMNTKAIHLEVVSDMTSEAFLAALRRFVGRRGCVTDMWSDNGTTFVGSAKELKKLFDAERSTVAGDVADWLASKGITWHFIPPHAPNFGGLWEAGVKSTKRHLKRIIGNSTLTFEEMSTVLAQVEACLNSRPICQLSSSPDDLTPLTPGHFLVGEPLVLVPDVNYENSRISPLKRWHLTQKMLQEFWRRWSSEYLAQLQQRYKWTDQISEPKIGDVVLVKEPDLPPAKWLFGLVIDKHPGLDKLTRVVSLKYKGHVIKRPISKLIVLPLAEDN